ncbi:MAG: dTDP-4-dehydrorhamnose reductase [Pseudomonas sp.]|nr:dTDP-4-dehydrorhamnose reductase [Pseudomonas sp.]
MRILVCGRHGQVALALQDALSGLGDVQRVGRDGLDLAHPEQLRATLRQIAPALIINAAAYTAVDQAESETRQAYTINAEAPRVLAEEAARLGAPLIHYSTDYVFDGSKSAPYDEDDTPSPLSVYGRSKLAGELAIIAVAGEHLILRTSWVYSLHGRNFLLTMQRLLQQRAQLNVVDDQVGAPTWATTIAARQRHRQLHQGGAAHSGQADLRRRQPAAWAHPPGHVGHRHGRPARWGYRWPVTRRCAPPRSRPGATGSR